MHEDDLRTPLRAGLYAALLDSGTTVAFARQALDVLQHVCGPHPLGLVLLEEGRATPLAGVDADVAACDRAACRTGPGDQAALAEAAGRARRAAPLPSDGAGASVPVREAYVEARAVTGGPVDAGGAARVGRPDWGLAMAAVGFTRATVLTAPVRPGTDLAVTWYHRAEVGDVGGPSALCVRELARSVALRMQAEEQATNNADLLAALASRATIDHAIGVLMAVHHCSADDAMKRLREASRRKNMKMRDLASSLVRDVTGSSPTTGAPFRSRPAGPAGKPLS